MKIVIDLTALADNFSGIERFALSISLELIKNKKNEYILVFKNSIHKSFQNAPANVKTVLIKSKSKFISAQIKLPIYLLSHKADIYFFPAFPAPFLLFNKNSVTTIHDLGCWDCPATDRKWMTWYFRILYWKASLCGKKIVTVSNFSKQRIAKLLKVKSENICIAYNGLTDIFRNTKCVEDKNEIVKKRYGLPEKYYLCLSTIEPRKNLSLLIEAYSKLYLEGKINCYLVLAGRKGWLVDSLFENIDQKVKDRVIFTGFIENEDLPYIYMNAEYFIFPSLYEGFGIPPIEAMSQECIVLSSDASSMPEILGDSAIYFENNNIVSLEEKMLYLNSLTDNEKCKIKVKGKKRAQMFSWKESASKIEKFFENNM